MSDKAMEAAVAAMRYWVGPENPLTGDVWVIGGGERRKRFDNSDEAHEYAQAQNAQAAITAYLAALEAEGWVLCPVEPSRAMIEAGAAADWVAEQESLEGACTAGVYSAMIAARPQVKG